MKGERRTPVPIDEQITAAYIDSAQKSQDLLGSELLGQLNEYNPETGDSLVGSFTEALIRNQLAVFYGTETYEEHLEGATKGAGFERPFGIVLPTLSPDIMVILYPKIVFPADEDFIQAVKEEGLEVATEGPQVMMYILDSYLQTNHTPEDTIANDFLFIPYMTRAHLTGKYPLETGEKSEEFQQQVQGAFDLVSRFTRSITQEQWRDLSPKIARFSRMGEKELEEFAQNFAKYKVEPIKPVGLRESQEPRQNPQEAVENDTEFLHLSTRDLPKRFGNDTTQQPWSEFTTNRWNSDAELYGRYETFVGNALLRVDYLLDSTHMPAKYGFFDTIEITVNSGHGITEHVILGQEMGNLFDPNSAFPVIIAGEFDFSDETLRSNLNLLAKDEGTKKEVARVLADILNPSNLESILQRQSTN